MKALLLVAASVTLAPFQCASDPEPEHAMYDSAPAALEDLAARFRERGEATSATRTLEYLVDRYPSSREAARARVTLGADSTTP